MPAKVSPTFATLGSVGRDNNRQPLGWGNQFVTADAAGTPVTSPISSVSSSSPQTLTIPGGATQVTLMPAVAMRVSEQSSMGQYAVIAANTSITLDVTKQTALYVKSDSTAGALSFLFTIL